MWGEKERECRESRGGQKGRGTEGWREGEVVGEEGKRVIKVAF